MSDSNAKHADRATRYAARDFAANFGRGPESRDGCRITPITPAAKAWIAANPEQWNPVTDLAKGGYLFPSSSAGSRAMLAAAVPALRAGLTLWADDGNSELTLATAERLQALVEYLDENKPCDCPPGVCLGKGDHGKAESEAEGESVVARAKRFRLGEPVH